MFIGSGTVINIIAVLIGSTLGVFIAHRLTEKIRDVVTDGLGLVTGMIAVLTCASITDPMLSETLGAGWPVLIVLASIVVGGMLGTAMREPQCRSKNGSNVLVIASKLDSLMMALRSSLKVLLLLPYCFALVPCQF